MKLFYVEFYFISVNIYIKLQKYIFFMFLDCLTNNLSDMLSQVFSSANDEKHNTFVYHLVFIFIWHDIA